MADVPSVKGVAFQYGWQRVRALVESGRIAMEELEFRLGNAGMELLDAKPEPSLWYPLAAADKLTALLVQVEGGGDPEYARELGREGLDSVLGRDSMKSLADGASSRRERAGHSLVGLSSLVYNFGEWTYQGDDLKRFEVRVTDASAFPMNSLLSAAGFMEALVDRLAGFRIHVSIERPDDDSVVFKAAAV